MFYNFQERLLVKREITLLKVVKAEYGLVSPVYLKQMANWVSNKVVIFQIERRGKPSRIKRERPHQC
jgi:hypothetical protein